MYFPGEARRILCAIGDIACERGWLHFPVINAQAAQGLHRLLRYRIEKISESPGFLESKREC